ncbi:MAG: helix-turn-helix domain-containing protein [Clostridia bacterium]|nr:helix-turn-helix domain-containing protein [Clostridia bacterium]
MTFEELIISRGFNPKNFARVAGLERESIRQYRRGISTPNINTAAIIAKTLGVSIDELSKCFEKKEG